MFSDKMLEKGLRVACGVQYHGGAYEGWQLHHQKLPSSLVENAVSVVADFMCVFTVLVGRMPGPCSMSGFSL